MFNLGQLIYSEIIEAACWIGSELVAPLFKPDL
jgi:hypothetical protein